MTRKGFCAIGFCVGAAVLLGFLLPSAQGAIQSKTATSLVIEDQGIMPDSTITEVVEFRITETDTGGSQVPDDGAAYVQALTVRVDTQVGTAADLVSNVAVYRILQPIDRGDFDFETDFDFALNRLIASREVRDNNPLVFNVAAALPSPAAGGISGDEILNTTAIYYVAVITTRTIGNEESFAIEVSDIRVVHPRSVDPNPTLTARTPLLRCVTSVGDLTPFADYIDASGTAVEYPLGAPTARALPHNYPDYVARHPDALNEMKDLEIPVVHPAESDLFPVLGIELAGVRSKLSGLVLNFVSVAEARNDDLDAWIDEPGGTAGAYDPAYDEIIRDVNRNGKYDAGDILLFAGANGARDARQLGVDDDMDGLTDEERLNGPRCLTEGTCDGNEDRDYYVDENGSGRYEPIGDEFYRDVDGDGIYSSPGHEDQIVDLDGTATVDPGTLLDRETIKVGDILTRFRPSDRIAFKDLNSNGGFDLAFDTLIHDFDGDGLVTLTPDRFVDGDGSVGRGIGDIEIAPGRDGTAFLAEDLVFTDNFENPQVVFVDNAPANGTFDEGERVILGNPVAGAPAGTYHNAADAVSVIWTYADGGNLAYDDGEDIWVNFISEQLAYSDRRDDEGVILGEPSSLAELDPLISASEIANLVYFDSITVNSSYDDGEDVYFELVPGGTYTDPTVAEGIRQGIIAGFSLRSGDAFLGGGAIALIDEDVNVSSVAELIDEDLRDVWYWVDSDENGSFDVVDLDGDRDFVPNEDVNGNGILDRRDNNGDGDFDDEEDYTEDLNGDGNLDLGVSGNDELYADYDGDGLYDPQVGGQEIDLDENVYPGADGQVDLQSTEPYPLVFRVDEDGDGERAADGSIPVSARAPVSVFGLQPSGEPFIMANGIDDDGDGLTDEGINEDLGDDAFNASTVRTHNDLVKSNDYLISDVERLLLFRDDGDGVFDPEKDLQISRDDPEQRDWHWVNVNPPVYTAAISIDAGAADPEGRRVPRIDGKNYDFFLVMSLDGDDEGDVFPEFGGAKIPDGLGVRYGDDFVVTLAPGGILTDAGSANEGEITKVQESILYMDDVIGYVGSDIQADDTGVSSFKGNPYVDAESSPIGVIGIDFANSPVFSAQSGGSPTIDAIEQVRVRFRGVGVDEVSGATDKGIFDVRIGDGLDSDGDGRIDEDPDNGADDDGDGLTDEDGGISEGNVVTLPDLRALADDSTGGVALYRDDDTPPGDGIDDDNDGMTDEELVNGLDDDADGLIDEDVGDGDPAGTNGVFDLFDDPLPLRNTVAAPLIYRLENPANPGQGVFVDLSPASGAVALPDDSAASTRGYDYYVVIRTSDEIEYRDSLKVSIDSRDVRFRSGRSAQNTAVSTDPISANVPVFMTDLTEPDHTIGANSRPQPVIGLNLSDRNPLHNRATAKIDYVVVSIFNVGSDNDFTPSDLLALTTYEDTNGNGVLDPFEDLNSDGILNTGYDSGIAIYRDEPGSLTNGGFDDPTDPTVPEGKADSLVYLSGGESFGNVSGFANSVLLKIDPLGRDPGDRGGAVSGETLPPSDTGEFAADDYFVVIRTSETIDDGDDFRVVIAPVTAGDRVQWPIHFLPVLRNGIFDYSSSYSSIETNPITANTRFSASITGILTPDDFLEAGSEPTAVMGIDLRDGGSPDLILTQVKVQIFPGDATLTTDDIDSGLQVRGDGDPVDYRSDLNPFADSIDSGLSIYKDSNGNGQFDPGVDQRLAQAAGTFQAVRDGGVLRRVDAVIDLAPGGDVPNDDLGPNAGADFFVTVRTSSQISYRDTFSVRIPTHGLSFHSGFSLGDPPVTVGPVQAGVPITFSDQTSVFGRLVGEESEPLPAIGLDLNVGRYLNDDPANPSFTHADNERLVSIEVQFNDEGGFAVSDIAQLLTGSPASGLALYRDADRTGDPEHFDTADTFTPLSSPFEFSPENEANLVLLDPANDGVLPRSDTDPDTVGPDYFIVFRTSAVISYNARFSITAHSPVFLHSNSPAEFTTGIVRATLVNRPPAIELLTPTDGATVSGGSFLIRWTDSDPDSNAGVSLFSITLAEFEAQPGVPLSDLQGTVPIPGAQDLPENLDSSGDTFSWAVNEVPPGEYVVIARISDERLSVFARSPGTLTIINHPPTFTFLEPDRQRDEIVKGLAYTTVWSGEDPENADSTTVALFLDDDLDPGDPGDPTPSIVLADPSAGLTLADSEFTFDTEGVPAGDYFVIAEVSNPANGTLTFDSSPNQIAISENLPPAISAIRVLRDGKLLTAGEVIAPIGSLTVTWQDQDEDSNARISIFVTSSPDGTDGVPAGGTYVAPNGDLLGSTGIPEDDVVEGSGEEVDTFAWDISELSPGTYYLLVEISDELNSAAAYFSGPGGPIAININHPPAFRFIEPDGIDDTVIRGEPFTVRWEDDDPDDNASIRLFVSVMGQQSTIAADVEEDDETDSFVFDTGGLPQTNKVTVYVMAAVEDGAQPEPIYAQSRGPITVLRNQPPRITVTRPALERPVTVAPEDATGEPIGAVAFDGKYEISWAVENDDEGRIDLYYDTDNRLLDGTLINTEGPILQSSGRSTYVWDLARSGITHGTYWIYAVVVDNASAMAFDYSDGPVTVSLPGSQFQFGGVVLDSAGGLHYLDPVPATPALVAPWGEYAAVVKARAGRSYLVAAKDGAVSVIGEYPVAGIDPGRTITFSGVAWDVVDAALSPDEEWVYVLHANGQIATYGSGTVNPFIRTRGVNFYAPYAVDLELTRSGRGAYLLDRFGGIIALGDAPQLPSPYFGSDIAVDLEVVEGGYYVLTSFGDLYPVGDVTGFESPAGLVGIVAMAAKDRGGVVLMDQFGILTTLGVDGFSVNDSALPLLESAADFVLLDSRYQNTVADALLALLGEFETAFAAENQAAIAPLISDGYNDGSRTTRDAYLSSLAAFFTSRDIMQFDLSNEQIQVDRETGDAVVTADSTFVVEDFKVTEKIANKTRGSLPFFTDTATPADRSSVPSVYRYKTLAPETVHVETPLESEAVILYIDRRLTTADPWHEVKTFGAGDLKDGGRTVLFDQGYEYRFVLANTSLIRDPDELVVLAITRFTSNGTKDLGRAETFVFEHLGGGGWKIRSSTVPP